MAAKSTKTAAAKTAARKVYDIEVVSNPNFCGIGAGSVQFAYGKAQVTDEWIAEWYRTHEGYKVTEADASEETPAEETADGK